MGTTGLALRLEFWTPMPSNQPSRDELARMDRRVTRGIGILVMIVGVAIAYTSAFTPFEQRVTFQWEFEDGERVPVTHVTCPSPWSVLADDAEPQGVVSGDLCIKPARGQVVQAIGITVFAIVIGLWIFTRDPRRGALPPLPQSVRALLRKR